MSDRTGMGVEQCMIRLTERYFGRSAATPDQLPEKGEAERNPNIFGGMPQLNWTWVDPPKPPPSNHAAGLAFDIQVTRDNIDAIKLMFGGVVEAFQTMFDKINPVVKDAAPAIDELLKVLQDLSDQSEAPPKQPLCIRHQHAMKGGRCPRCERENYRKGHGYR